MSSKNTYFSNKFSEKLIFIKNKNLKCVSFIQVIINYTEILRIVNKSLFEEAVKEDKKNPKSRKKKKRKRKGK